jgi:hypothetical protein
VIDADGRVPDGFIASTPGLPGNPVEARTRLAEDGVEFIRERASRDDLYSVKQWRDAGCPSSAAAVAARVLSEVDAYVDGQLPTLRITVEELFALVRADSLPADVVAVTRAIIVQAPQDIPAHNRLGCPYHDLGLVELARAEFEAVLRLGPTDPIAAGISTKRLKELSKVAQGE